MFFEAQHSRPDVLQTGIGAVEIQNFLTHELGNVVNAHQRSDHGTDDAGVGVGVPALLHSGGNTMEVKLPQLLEI